MYLQTGMGQCVLVVGLILVLVEGVDLHLPVSEVVMLILPISEVV